MKKIFEQLKFFVVDLKRWQCQSFRDIFYLCFERGIWAALVYRVIRMLFLIKIPVIKIFLRLIAFFMMTFSEWFLGVSIKPEADIGPGLYIGHVGLIRIHPKVKVGKNLSMGQETVIGQKGGGIAGAPKIGDDVYIGVGAKVLGPITIGNNVKIGANAVVVKNVPDNATAVGVPARIIGK